MGWQAIRAAGDHEDVTDAAIGQRLREVISKANGCHGRGSFNSTR